MQLFAGGFLELSGVASAAGPLQASADGTITAVGVVAIAVLIGLSGFFSSSEIAIFSLGNHRIATLVDEGAAGAETLDSLTSNPRRLW